MCQLSFEQELYHTYVVIEPQSKNEMDQYGIKILQNNTLNYFLPFQIRSKDGILRYYYEVPENTDSGKISARDISQEQMEMFVEGLIGALDEIDEYLLDENDIFLEPEGIFRSGENKYVFIYYPGYGGDFRESLKNIAALFLKGVDYTCTDAVRRVYEFYHLVCNENSSIRNLRGFILSANKSPDDEKIRTEEILCEKKVEEFQVKAEDIKENNEENRSSYVKDTMETSFECITNGGICAVAGMVCILLLGMGVLATRIFYYISREWIIAVTAVLMGITCAVAGGMMIFNRKKACKDDFWKPEDYISLKYDRKNGSNEDISMDTALLHDTVVLQGKEPEILLKSTDLRLCGHIYISSFPAIIGKAVADAGCRIMVPTISRRHARLDYKENEFFLTDLHSSNGTFINGESIPAMKPVAIHFGDSVIFSDVEFIFETEEVKE